MANTTLGAANPASISRASIQGLGPALAEGISRSQREGRWVSLQLTPQSPHAPPWFPGPKTRTCPARASGRRRHPGRAVCGAATSAPRRPQICPARLAARPRRSPGSPGHPRLCAARSGTWLCPRRAMWRTRNGFALPTTSRHLAFWTLA